MSTIESSPTFKPSRRQELQTLKYILSKKIRNELSLYVQAPSTKQFDNMPHLEYVFNRLIKKLPLIELSEKNNEEKKFWEKTEELLQLLQALNTSAPYRTDSTLERMKLRIEKLLAVYFKHVYSANNYTVEDKQIEREKEKYLYLNWLENSKLNERALSIVQESKFKVEILFSRKEQDRNGKFFEVRQFITQESILF